MATINHTEPQHTSKAPTYKAEDTLPYAHLTDDELLAEAFSQTEQTPLMLELAHRFEQTL